MTRKPSTTRFRALAYAGGEWRYVAAKTVIDLAGLTKARAVPLLLDGQRVGHVDEMLVDAGMLVLAGPVYSHGSKAREVVASAAAGYPWQSKLRLRVDTAEKFNDTIRINGKMFDGPLAVVRASFLYGLELGGSDADEDSVVQFTRT